MPTRGLLILSTVLLVLAVQSAASAQRGGYAEAAHACEEGGYTDYTRADGSPFTSTGDCVRYVATGGTLQPRVTAPRISSIEVTYSTSGNQLILRFMGSGFEAGTTVFVVWSHPEYWTALNYPGKVDADGTIDGVIASPAVASCIPSSGSLTVKTYPALEVLATASYALTCPA